MSFDEGLCHPTQASRPSVQCIYSVCATVSHLAAVSVMPNACVTHSTCLSTQIRCSPYYHRRIRLRMVSLFQIHVCIVFIIVQSHNRLCSYQLLLISCHT